MLLCTKFSSLVFWKWLKIIIMFRNLEKDCWPCYDFGYFRQFCSLYQEIVEKELRPTLRLNCFRKYLMKKVQSCRKYNQFVRETSKKIRNFNFSEDYFHIFLHIRQHQIFFVGEFIKISPSFCHTGETSSGHPSSQTVYRVESILASSSSVFWATVIRFSERENTFADRAYLFSE